MPSSRRSGRIAPDAKRSVTRRRHDRLSRTLTPREREVMALVVAGRPNAQISGRNGHKHDDSEDVSWAGDAKDGRVVTCGVGEDGERPQAPIPRSRSASTIVQRPQYLLGSWSSIGQLSAGIAADYGLRAR